MEAKPVYWIKSSKDDLCEFPEEVVREIGYALYFAQLGDKHPAAKVLKGFGSAGVLEVKERLKLAEKDHRERNTL